MPLPGTVVLHPSALVGWRRRAKKTMPDRCIIGAAGGWTTDPVTGVTSYTPGVTKYPLLGEEGYCRFEPRPTTDRVAPVGDNPTSFRAYQVALPHDAPAFLVDDVFTATDSEDAQAIGRPMRVAEIIYTSLQTERILIVEDNLG